MKMERKQKRQLIKIVVENLSKIYKTAYSVAKEWDKNTIPLNIIKVIIDKAVPRISGNEKDINLFVDNYKKTLNVLIRDLTSIAKKMDSKSVPLKTLKEGLNVIKENFILGLNKDE